MAGSFRGMAVGGGHPDGGGGLWTVRLGGDGAGRVVEDLRCVGPTVGARKRSSEEGWGRGL